MVLVVAEQEVFIQALAVAYINLVELGGQGVWVSVLSQA
jgi:hypothetical protein